MSEDRILDFLESSVKRFKAHRREWRQAWRCIKASAITFTVIFVWICLGSFTWRPEIDVLQASVSAESIFPTPYQNQMDLAEAEPETDEAELIAKVLYGAVLYRSEEVQEAMVWLILNRVDSPLYPSTIKDVVLQPSQWQGFSEDNPVLQSLYDLASDVIAAWENGGVRPIPQDCLFLVINYDNIELRTSWDGGNKWIVEG